MTKCRATYRCFVLSLLAAIASETGACGAGELTRHVRTELHMGVEFEAVLYSADAALAEKALTAAMARVAALDKTLSDYDLESELNKLSATSTVADPRGGAGERVSSREAQRRSVDRAGLLAASQ